MIMNLFEILRGVSVKVHLIPRKTKCNIIIFLDRGLGQYITLHLSSSLKTFRSREWCFYSHEFKKDNTSYELQKYYIGCLALFE